MDKELFKKTEAILYGYNNLALIIELLKIEIKDLEDYYKGCVAIRYEERTQATNKFSSTVENELVERERNLKILKNDLKNKITLKRRSDKAVQGLRDEERKLIELRYINKRSLSWKQIAFALKYSQGYCRKDLRKKSIIKISDIIFYNSKIQ